MRRLTRRRKLRSKRRRSTTPRANWSEQLRILRPILDTRWRNRRSRKKKPTSRPTEKNRETTRALKNWKKRRERPVASCRHPELERLLPAWQPVASQQRTARRFPKPYWKPKSEKRKSWNSKRHKRKLRRCWRPRRLATAPWMRALKFVVRYPRRGYCSGRSVAARSAVPIEGGDGAVDGASAAARTRWCRRSANCSRKGRKF